jgi:periplasmic protein TonB
MPLNVLLLSKDSDLTRALSGVLESLEIAVEHCSEPFPAAKRLMDRHFDAVFVDCDDQQGAAWVLQSARMASRNKTALTVAILGEKSGGRAAKLNENFILNKPLEPKQAESTLRVAKNLMVKNQGESANPGAAASARSPFSPGAVASPPKQQGATAMSAATQLSGEDAMDALETLGQAPKPPQSLPSAPELLARMEETFPAPLSHPTASHGSAAAAAPAREPSPVPARSEPHPKREDKHLDQAPRAATPAGVSAESSVPKAAAANPPFAGRIAPLDKQRTSESKPRLAGPQKPVPEAAAPAVQPLAPDTQSVPAPEFRSSLLESAGSDSPAQRSPRVAMAIAIALLIVGALAFSFWRMHQRSRLAQPATASAALPAATPVAATVPQPPASAIAKPSATAASAAPQKPSNTNASPAQTTAKAAKGEAQSVVVADQGTIRMPGALKQPSAQEEESVAPPTGVVEPGSAPNLGHVVAAVPAAMPAPVPAQRITVSQGVSQGLLIHQVNPLYPAIARDAHVGGAVRLRAIIGKDGAVHSLSLLGGHPLLAKTAMDAVRQWKYKPYLLNGQPVEVQTEITVQFKM